MVFSLPAMVYDMKVLLLPGRVRIYRKELTDFHCWSMASFSRYLLLWVRPYLMALLRSSAGPGNSSRISQGRLQATSPNTGHSTSAWNYWLLNGSALTWPSRWSHHPHIPHTLFWLIFVSILTIHISLPLNLPNQQLNSRLLVIFLVKCVYFWDHLYLCHKFKHITKIASYFFLPLNVHFQTQLSGNQSIFVPDKISQTY